VTAQSTYRRQQHVTLSDWPVHIPSSTTCHIKWLASPYTVINTMSYLSCW